MKVGDVVLLKTDGDTDLRYVGVVSAIDGDYVEFVQICTTMRGPNRVLYSLDTESSRYADDLMVIGHVDQGLMQKVSR